MKTPRIVNAIGQIDDGLVLDAVNYKSRKKCLVKWGAVAACFAAVIIVGVTLLPMLLNGNSVNPNKTDSRYKEFGYDIENVAIVWPWEYLAESEKSYTTEINGIKYAKNSGYAVSEEFIGDKIGNYNFVGYDSFTETYPTVMRDVYKLKNVNETEFLAVKVEGNYYVFKNDVYNPPQTLGELFERVDLSQFLKLEQYSENGSGPSAKHFLLNDDEYVWEILSDCKNAAFIDQNQEYWHLYERDFISFTVSSEILGVYKQMFAVTEDGYLETNVFDWGYLYYIGEEAAEKIIKYAKKNSVKADYEPYSNSNSVCGEIVEITDEYILVDDSILCKNSEDGITYKVLVNDIRILRYVDKGIIEVGDTVQISYKGETVGKGTNEINSAFEITQIDIFYNNYEEEEEQKYNTNGSTAEQTASFTVE